MYRVPRYTISLVRETSLSVEEKIVRESSIARDIFMPMFVGADREQFVVMALDAKHKVIGLNRVSVGSLMSSLVHPREVFKLSILLNAAAIIIGHNHPSGDCAPSPEDYALTTRLRKGGELLGIPVLDHLILSDDRTYVSFADSGYFS